ERFHQGFHPWTDFTKMTVVRRRSTIGLHFEWYNPEGDGGKGRLIPWEELLYCRKAQLDNLIAIIREPLPESTPYEEAYIPIYALWVMLPNNTELVSRALLTAMETSDVLTQTPDPAAPAGLAVQG